MKMNMIISKKHIVLSALVLALSVAVYLNWEYVKINGDSFENTSKVAVEGPVDGVVDGMTAPAPTGDGTGGEDADAAAAYGEAYFAEAKLSRTKARDEAADALKYMLEDANLTTDQMTQLTMEAASIAKSIETEGKIENLIKARGFAECMVYLEEDRIDVLVKCTDMTDSEAAQIKDVILSEVEVPDKNISIIEIK